MGDDLGDWLDRVEWLRFGVARVTDLFRLYLVNFGVDIGHEGVEVNTPLAVYLLREKEKILFYSSPMSLPTAITS